jgi:hypothetical protein
MGKQCEKQERTQDRTCPLVHPTLRLRSLHYGHTIASSLIKGERRIKETTSIEVFLVPFLNWLGMSTIARTPIGGDRDFHRQNQRRVVPEPWL